MSIQNIRRLLIVAFGLLFTIGCTGNTERIAKILAERPPSTCQLPFNGELLDFTGPVCERAAADYVKSLRFQACEGFAAEGEKMCLFAVALTSVQQGNSDSVNDDYQLLIAGMQEDGRNTRFWGGKILDVGMFGVDRHYDAKDSKHYYSFLEKAAGGSNTYNITKSDDGMGEGGRGGDGDMIVYTGDKGQVINRSDGSAISAGRNPVFMGLNRPDSSFETQNNNNNNAEGATNNNDPAVQASDDDGGQRVF